ncbi:MAG: S-adenosylmethionine:tRNA ribosyltransferase-isomerase [Prevotellaceae bacterium]|jgi:S-adenosylmethionine:tRNA ribosyltransferase-isomerase|nr:S-adenosylmethionine:tRNA ribosyltransferase-isomerase [Prevotellaceae bacterium]
MNPPDPRNIRIQTYNYPLPDERIAKYPLPVRDSSKLLVYRSGDISETRFHDLPSLLPADSLMVFNNTRVIQARLHFHKASGALIEVFCLEPLEPHDYVLNFQQTGRVTWLCLIGNLKKWKGETLRRHIEVKGQPVTLTADRGELQGTSYPVTFGWDNPLLTFADILEAFGELPIPPYLHRDTEPADKETYQTVYAKPEGSVAAPTAGLHFTPAVLSALDRRGIEREEVTLHVGAGTFRPVKSELIAAHEMHTETFAVSLHTLQRLIAHGGRAIAVGTTSVRTLESLYHIGVALLANPNLDEADLCVRQWQPYDTPSDIPAVEALQAVADYLCRHHLDTLHTGTQIIIAPGYRYRIVRAIITNFHQPQSTLLLLVSAFVGEGWRDIYDYALSHDFRFLSYGDSSLLIP